MAITQSQFEQVYNGAILSEDSDLQPSLQAGQDLYFKQKGVSLVAATATQEIQNLENNIIPSSSSAVFLYKHAASLGIPVITGALPTFGDMSLIIPGGGPSTSPVAFVIPAGSILTNSASAVQYFVTADVPVGLGDLFADVVIPFMSVLSGSDTYSPPGTFVIFSTPLVLSPSLTIIQAVVSNDVVSGTNTPTDLYVSALVSSYMQNPRGGGSTGDYLRWALESNPTIVTDAKIIPAGAILNQNIIYVAIMGGTSDPNVNIELAFPISRTISQQSQIAITNAYIEGLRPVNDNPAIASVQTYAITDDTLINPTNPNPSITLSVVLAQGLSLSTPVVGTNGQTKTVEEWIQYQTRYAILSSPYTGTIVDGEPYILGTWITTVLLNGLADSNNLNGYLCSILVNVEFSYTDDNVTNSINIPVPNSTNYFIPPTVSTPPYLEIIYDLDVNIITIILE